MQQSTKPLTPESLQNWQVRNRKEQTYKPINNLNQWEFYHKNPKLFELIYNDPELTAQSAMQNMKQQLEKADNNVETEAETTAKRMSMAELKRQQKEKQTEN